MEYRRANNFSVDMKLNSLDASFVALETFNLQQPALHALHPLIRPSTNEKCTSVVEQGRVQRLQGIQRQRQGQRGRVKGKEKERVGCGKNHDHPQLFWVPAAR